MKKGGLFTLTAGGVQVKGQFLNSFREANISKVFTTISHNKYL